MIQQIGQAGLCRTVLFQLELRIDLHQALNQQQDQKRTEGCDGVRNTFDHLY
ncbi:hypothetical protein D3C80_1576210 [compost metagenome]